MCEVRRARFESRRCRPSVYLRLPPFGVVSRGGRRRGRLVSRRCYGAVGSLSEHQEALRGGRRRDRGCRGGLKNWGSKSLIKPCGTRACGTGPGVRAPRPGGRRPAGRRQRLTRAATSLTGACDARGAYTRHRRVRPASLPYWPFRAHARLTRAVAGGVSGVSSVQTSRTDSRTASRDSAP